jgi:hypothetical protein
MTILRAALAPTPITLLSDGSARNHRCSFIQSPRPIRQLATGTFEYGGTLELSDQVLSVMATLVAVDESDNYVVTQSSTISGKQQTDRTVLEKKSLALLRRTIWQGSQTTNITVCGGVAVIRSSPATTAPHADILVRVDGLLFADGPADSLALTTLPLSPGYTATYSNLSLQPPKMRTVQLSVVGRDQTTVRAGTFDTFIVMLTSPEDENSTTYSVARDFRRIVKVVATGPCLNNGRLALELLESGIPRNAAST